LVDAVRQARLETKQAEIARVVGLLEKTRDGEVTLARLLLRTDVGWPEMVARLPALQDVSAEVAEHVVCDLKYAGYVARQEIDVARQKRLSEKRIPDQFDYGRITQLRHEAREKLTRVRPASLAQASRISGITPADMALLMVHLDGAGAGAKVKGKR
jgi:tRNA uridine 5-carboxymethylaminomethyl modification enzyme